MARTARVVGQGLPHHVIQRGNRRQRVFFSDEDKNFYLKLLRKKAREHQLQIWAYCLMDNHVHMVVVPSTKESLAACIGEIHKEYTKVINFREGWCGYLWQGRFRSFILDEAHVYAAVRYVERNAVRAGLVSKAEEYRWSSAWFRVKCVQDGILSKFYLMDNIKDWKGYLAPSDQEKDLGLLREHGVTGKPLGSAGFLEELGDKLGMELTPKKRGRRPKK